jgi:ribosomal protein L7/L12
MATKEVVLRPGDSISVRLEVPGQPLRLELTLTPEGVAVGGPVAMGAPTIFGGVPPAHSAPEPVDLTDEFEAEDMSVYEEPAPGPVESLAAVEPFGDPQAVDIPFDDVTNDFAEDSAPQAAAHVAEEVTDDSAAGDDLDLDLGDLGDDLGDDLGMDDAATVEETDDATAIDIPDEDDIPDVDFSLGDEPAVDIPDEGAIDIPAEDDGFSADAMTMVPPTRKQAEPEPAMLDLSLEEDDGLERNEFGEIQMDEDGNPKKKFAPGPEDTLPVWTGKARTYKDPEVEKKKKETAKLEKKPMAAAKPAAKPLPGKPAAAKPLPAAKPPITKQIKKPGAGAAAASAKKPAVADAGNFTVFLSPPKGADKKQAAAEIIAEIQGIDMNSAMALAGKMIVPVVKGVSEDEAQGVRDRFKDAGLSCRITQKR